jgi:probable HAF family extracellular repeat protein
MTFAKGFTTLAAALATAFSTAAHPASYVFTTIDYPGAVFTDVRGVNNNGQIVGYAWLADEVPFGFVYAGGNYTRLPAGPGGEATSAHGINDHGVVVGSAPVNGVGAGFIYDSSGYHYHPRNGMSTFFRAIGNDGRVTGYSDRFDAQGQYLGFSPGFIFDPSTGTYNELDVPGTPTTIAQGINISGTVVGSGQGGPEGASAFIRAASGSMTLFRVDGLSTKARGINDSGLVAGFVEEGGSSDAGAPAFTFVGVPPNNQNIAIEGMVQTIGEGINNAGQVVGLFRDPAGHTHGFLATPAELPAGFTNGAFTFSVPVEAYTPVFIDPEVALGYQYDTGKGDPPIVTVRLPIGIGDSLYTVIVGGKVLPLAGGQLLDFRTAGFPKGVTRFRVTDIELEAALDPVNPHAFPTELTFAASGRFTGTMTALCLKQSLPPQAGPALRRALTKCVR